MWICWQGQAGRVETLHREAQHPQELDGGVPERAVSQEVSGWWSNREECLLWSAISVDLQSDAVTSNPEPEPSQCQGGGGGGG